MTTKNQLLAALKVALSLAENIQADNPGVNPWAVAEAASTIRAAIAKAAPRPKARREAPPEDACKECVAALEADASLRRGYAWGGTIGGLHLLRRYNGARACKVSNLKAPPAARLKPRPALELAPVFDYPAKTTRPLELAAWYDQSWHNDASASCTIAAPTKKHPQGVWRLWVQADDYAERELPEAPTYQLDWVREVGSWDEDAGDRTILKSDSLEEVLDRVAEGV